MKIKGVFFLRWFGINGIVLYPFILFSSVRPDEELLKHEEIHWQQIKHHGFFKFYFDYLSEYLTSRRSGFGHYHSYRNISFEQEAFNHQKEAEYKVAESNRAKS